MNQTDVIVKYVLEQHTANLSPLNMCKHTPGLFKDGKLVKNALVCMRDKSNNEVTEFSLESAEQKAAVNLVKIVLDTTKDIREKEVDFVKTMLLGLVHYITKREANMYRDSRVEKYLDTIYEELYSYIWFSRVSKNTYPFEIGFDFHKDSYTERKFVTNPDRILINILNNSINRYELVLVESNPRGHSDFYTTDYISSIDMS